MRGSAAVAALACALFAAGCGPKVKPKVEMAPDARGTDFSAGPSVSLTVLHALGDTDGHLAVELSVVNRAAQDIPGDAVQATYTDADGHAFPPLRAGSAPIATGASGTVAMEFDLAFAAEGTGRLQVSGLPEATRPIAVDWVKRAPPPPADEHADEIARKIFVGIGVGILVIGYVALRIWAGQ